MSKENNAKDTEVFVISVAAELAGMHAQTLRSYDRMGLVTPQRTRGGGRRYTRDDVKQLREIQRLSHDEGVNRAGIKAITRLQEEKSRLEAKLADTVANLQAGIAPVAPVPTLGEAALMAMGLLLGAMGLRRLRPARRSWSTP